MSCPWDNLRGYTQCINDPWKEFQPVTRDAGIGLSAIATKSCVVRVVWISPATLLNLFRDFDAAVITEHPYWILHPANRRDERIRTSDTRVPNAVLYQAELHLENTS